MGRCYKLTGRAPVRPPQHPSCTLLALHWSPEALSPPLHYTSSSHKKEQHLKQDISGNPNSQPGRAQIPHLSQKMSRGLTPHHVGKVPRKQSPLVEMASRNGWTMWNRLWSQHFLGCHISPARVLRLQRSGDLPAHTATLTICRLWSGPQAGPLGILPPALRT